MKKSISRITWLSFVAISLLMIFMTACSRSIFPDSSITSTPISNAQCQAVKDGITYLKTQYNPGIGLIREAPNAAPHVYWLANDNVLSAFVLMQLGENDFSQTLSDTIRQYGKPTNGLIEILWGKKIAYPPHLSQLELVKQIGDEEIWQEFHTDGDHFDDWRDYTNLALLGALNSEYQGNHPLAQNIYSHALEQYDGIGFQDKAFIDKYETYKLALALYVGSEIRQLPPDSDKMLSALIGLQNTDGGFFTHYTNEMAPAGDTNTETTAFALLALNAVGCGNK